MSHNHFICMCPFLVSCPDLLSSLLLLALASFCVRLFPQLPPSYLMVIFPCAIISSTRHLSISPLLPSIIACIEVEAGHEVCIVEKNAESNDHK